MDSFLGAIVFLLPGVLAYFWLQAFGINPVVKHSPTEFTAVAGLLWLPVSFGTLLLYNLAIWLSSYISQAEPIWTLLTLKDASNNFIFLFIFLLLSVLVSFVYSYIWALWGFKLQQDLTNWVRKKRGLAGFSDTTSVWDEVFGKHEVQIVEIGKIDKPESKMIGEIKKAPRPFEPERNLFLSKVERLTKLADDYVLPVDAVFVDTKTGTYVKIFKNSAVEAALAADEITSPVEEAACQD